MSTQPLELPRTGAQFASQQRTAESQLVLLALACAVSWLILAVQAPEGLLPTGLLVVLVGTAGVILVHQTSLAVGDSRVRNLGYWHLLKLPLVLSILYWGWVPDLDPMFAYDGYDPQRYYFQAQELAESGFGDWELVSAVNYGGILYFYGSMFCLFGHNPAAPALINCLTTLIAALLVVRVAYLIRPEPWNGWVCGLMLLLPELVWYDALTSRESIAMALMTSSTLPLGMLFLRQEKFRLLDWRCALSASSMLLLASLRTSMLVPAAAVILILFLTLRVDPRKRLIGFAMLGVTCVLLTIAPMLATNMRTVDFSYLRSLQMAREFSETQGAEWSERSFGQMLIPKTPLQEIVFAPIRLAFYIVTPLPNLSFKISGLIGRSWEDWQGFLTCLSAGLNLLILPRSLTSLAGALRNRAARPQLLLHVPCWVVLASIAFGNVIISARYRVMAMGFFWATSCLVTPQQKKTLFLMNLLWFGALGAGGVVYFLYKF